MNATATEPAPQPSPPTDRKPDPREALDALKQVEVIALLTWGFSRRTAARHVGVTHTTIARTAARYPHFAKQLADAERRADFNALKMVRDASQQDKYWRAAAWLLERRLPDEFGHRAPHSFSGDQVMAMLAQVFSYTLPALKEEQADQFVRSFNGTLREVEAAVQHADRWHNMAADDDAPDGAPLRSPYEHPQWYDPAATGKLDSEVKSKKLESGAQPAAASAESQSVHDPARESERSNGRRNGHSVPAEAGTTSACKEAPADVCQFSQEEGEPSEKLLRRKLLNINDLAASSRSVPKRMKPRGGEDNGHHLAHLGNGHS